MKKFIKEKWFSLIASFYSMLVMLMWIAMRVNYAGIAKALGADKLPLEETINPTTFKSFIVMCLPNIFALLTIAAFLFSICNIVFNKNNKKLPIFISLGISVLFTIVIYVVFDLGSKDYASYILPKFWSSLLIACLIIIFAFILFFPIQNSKVGVAVKGGIMAVVVILSIIIGYDLKPNYFTYDSVVYAVEDEYQIVYSTNDTSTAWVEVNGKKYYDLYAGSMKSNDLVHKISVPQKELDNAGSYKIYAQQVIYRGPFGGDLGNIISKEHRFYAPKASDGIKYYSVSDVHEVVDPAVQAIVKQGDIDFLIINGDTCSDVEGEDFANLPNKLANLATNGERPVIYSRGNHECKGNYSETLYKYVGSKNEKFYYEVSLDSNNIHLIVLDLGEDHDNDGEWWEYYGTDQYNSYRDEQTELLKSLKSEDLNDSYNIVVCHIPIVFVNHREDHISYKHEWTTILNNLPIDAALYGHQHDLIPYVPGAVTPFTSLTMNSSWWEDAGKPYSKAGKEHLTDFNFYGYMIGRTHNLQSGSCDERGSEYSGLLISVDKDQTTQTACWTNAEGNIVLVMNPFTNDSAKEYYINTLRAK